MNDEGLITYTRELVCGSCSVEAELLLYIGEIDARTLFLERTYPSMIYLPRASDCGGDVERRFSKDELLANV